MSIYDELENLRKQYQEMEQTKVSVALFGQPGAGKSSLINRLVGEKVAKVGTKNDVTQTENSHEWNGLYLVDLPGYGTEMFPADTYFEKFDVLKFDFFLCVFSDVRLKEDDIKFFKKLKEIGKACLFVCNKTDVLWQDDLTLDQIKADIETNIEEQIGIKQYVYFTCCKTNDGLDALTEGIYDLLGDIDSAKQEKWVKSAKAYSETFLEGKKRACEKTVTLAAAVSAANGLNPIPGLDVAVDLGVLVGLFTKLRKDYGLTDEKLELIKIAIPVVAPLVKNVVQYAAADGVLLLLNKFAGRVVAKQFSKWIPLVGQALASSVGFTITMTVGNTYLHDCHEIAKAMLEEEINKKR